MLTHNILLFLRNIKKYKSTFLINIVGLSTGLACVILISLWVMDELGFDKFHKNDQELYQVWNRFERPDGVTVSHWTPDLLAETMAEKLAEVKMAAAVISAEMLGEVALFTGEKNLKAPGSFAGSDYFKIFSYELVHGNKNDVLKDANAIVISESLAHKLYGSAENAIGKPLEWNALNTQAKHQVSGVFKDIPSNSSQQFDFVLPFEAFKKVSANIGRPIDWNFNAPLTYIVLQEGTNVEQFASKVKGFSKQQSDKVEADLLVKKYSSNYLYGKFENGETAGGRIEYIYLFSTIALFILLIACINFMNLSTANASRRLKEIGIKKALGSGRGTLIKQHFGESVLTSFLALFIALILVYLFVPEFNSITGKNLSLSFNPKQIGFILTVVLLTGLIAGSYPALHLSRFNPVAVLKGKLKGSLSELWVRKGLVVFQFTLSIILIVAVLVVHKQIDFIQSENQGMDKDNVVYFNKEGGLEGNVEAFIREMEAIPGIVKASSTVQNIIGTEINKTNGLNWPGKVSGQDISFYEMGINYGFTETLNVGIKEGRTFSRDFASDQTAIIFNESAIKSMGLEDPVGKIIDLWGEKRKIVGVMKDFHFQSFRETVKPMFFRIVPEQQSFVFMARIEAGREKEVLQKLENTYSKFNPGYVFDYKFLDEDFQALYNAENRVSSLSGYFAAMAILISCLGLFGLAAFTAERRRKEIGIRKALGQSSKQITVLFSGEFAKLISVSILFGLPLGYILINNWLSGFAYRINLHYGYFLLAGATALAVALCTVSVEAVRAAYKNPVESLREE